MSNMDEIIRRKIITKVFYNGEASFFLAQQFAKENNLEMLTAYKDFKTWRWYWREHHPEYYSFTFITN